MIPNKVVLIVLAFLIGGSVAFALTSGKPNTITPPLTQGSTVKKEDTGTLPRITPKETAGLYIPYSSKALFAYEDQKRVLYFHAPWCPVCIPLDKEFQARANEIPAGVVIYKTDYDTETELKTRYAVTYQHTFVQVDREGKEIAKWNGGGFDEALVHIK